MLRLIRVTLLIAVICAAATVTTRLIGGLWSSPLEVLFTDPDGSPCERPCMFGLRPGKTKFRPLPFLLRHPLLEGFLYGSEKVLIGPVGKAITISIDFYPGSNSIVRSISLEGYHTTGSPNPNIIILISSILPGPASLGDVVSLFGPPDAVWVQGANAYLYFRTEP